MEILHTPKESFNSMVVLTKELRTSKGHHIVIGFLVPIPIGYGYYLRGKKGYYFSKSQMLMPSTWTPFLLF